MLAGERLSCTRRHGVHYGFPEPFRGFVWLTANKSPPGGIYYYGRVLREEAEVEELGRIKSFAMPCKTLSDEQDAVARFLSKPSDDTFHELFRGLAPRIVGYFRVRGCEIELAEDLAQEVMLAVYKEAHSLRDRALFRAWMYRIARNALLRHLRDTGRRVETVELGAETEELHQAGSDPTLPSQFAEWMAWLRPDERQVMMLRYVDELEHHEIAQVLGIPLGTVQWKIFHTKRKLAARFGVKTT